MHEFPSLALMAFTAKRMCFTVNYCIDKNRGAERADPSMIFHKSSILFVYFSAANVKRGINANEYAKQKCIRSVSIINPLEFYTESRIQKRLLSSIAKDSLDVRTCRSLLA